MRESCSVRAENDASRERLRRIVEGLDAHALTAALPGGWTVSALLAHLAWWDRLALRRWEEFLRSGTRPTYLDDAVNDELLPEWLSVRPRDAVREVLEAAEAVDRLIATVPEAILDEMKRSGWERGVDRNLHRNEHLGEIGRSAKAS